MKVKNANASPLTNFEVLNFLRARGASTDPTRVIAPVPPSEYKESIDEFFKSCEKFKLAKAEKLSIINIRPSTQVEIDPIIEECQKGLADEEVEELVELISSLFPPTPKREGPDEDEEGSPDGSPMEGIADVKEGTPDEDKEGTDGLTLDDTDENKEGTDGFTWDDPDEDKEGFSDGLLPEGTYGVIEGTTDGLTLANTDDW